MMHEGLAWASDQRAKKALGVSELLLVPGSQRNRPPAVALLLTVVLTSPVVPTLFQPPEGVEDTKIRLKTIVSPTSPRGPNLFLHIHLGERKTSGTCFSIRKGKAPRWGHRGWDHIGSSCWNKMITGCPNPEEGWDHAVGGWDWGESRVDSR